MMKAPDAIAIAVRRPDNSIVLKRTPYAPPSAKHKWMGWPFIRGIINMGTMFSTGMSTIQQSTDMLGVLDEEPTKFEKWLSKKLGKGIDKIVMGTAVVLAIVLSLFLFMVLPTAAESLARSWWPGMSKWAVNLLGGVLRIIIFIAYILLCTKVPDVRRTFEYHGSEHKTVYCHEHDLPLTPENAQQFSTLHPRCGTSFLLLVMVIAILLSTLAGYQGDVYIWRLLSRLALLPVVAGVSYELLKLLAHSDSWIAKALRWPGMQLQRLTTKPPTDAMCEIAICAMNVALHGMPEGEPLPGGYVRIRDYRLTDPAYVSPVTAPAAEAADEAREEAAAQSSETTPLD